MLTKKKAVPIPADQAEAQIKDFFDLIAPSTIKFNIDHSIVGDSYR